MTCLPSLFVSHGAPMIALEDSPANRFLRGLSESLPRPKAILLVSAHWETGEPALSLAATPETIHDFYGFPQSLYDLRYAAPGAPDLARQAAALIRAAGMTAVLDESRGLDHGAWIPLLLAYPQARVPVTQLSVQTGKGPAHHLALGRALAPLRKDGVLILGSGSLTHDLSSFRGQAPDAPPPDWVIGFADWVEERIKAGAVEALVDYRKQAPFAERNHPTEEHLLPLHVALGAGLGASGEDGEDDLKGLCLHRSYDRAVLAMDAYAFGL